MDEHEDVEQRDHQREPKYRENDERLVRRIVFAINLLMDFLAVSVFAANRVGLGDKIAPFLRMWIAQISSYLDADSSRLGMAFRVSRPPGSTLLAIADFLFSKKTVDLTFKQIIADWRVEYFEALHAGRQWKARWINIRYYRAYAAAFGLSKIWQVIRSVFRIQKSQ